MHYLIKGSNTEGDRYEFGTRPDAKEPPVLRLGQGDYIQDWEGKDISWKWKDFEPILLVCSTLAFISGALMGMVFG